MEAIIQAKKLKEQVGALQGILDRKATIPILSRIKIEASECGDLVMTATDLDVSLIVEQETDILRPGSICLSGKKLGLITGNLPNEPVHLRLDEQSEKVEFRAGNFKSKLSGAGSEQFPEVPRVAGEAVKIPASVFFSAAVVISGDTTPHAKPHPAPLLEAAKRLGIDPAACVYVGDDERDIVAGHAALMKTVAATYGYLGVQSDVKRWQAHAQIETPAQLLDLLAV